MGYLRASGERLTELRQMSLWELHRDFKIVHAQQERRRESEEKLRLTMEQRRKQGK